MPFENTNFCRGAAPRTPLKPPGLRPGPPIPSPSCMRGPEGPSPPRAPASWPPPPEVPWPPPPPLEHGWRRGLTPPQKAERVDTHFQTLDTLPHRLHKCLNCLELGCNHGTADPGKVCSWCAKINDNFTKGNHRAQETWDIRPSGGAGDSAHCPHAPVTLHCNTCGGCRDALPGLTIYRNMLHSSETDMGYRPVHRAGG